MVKAGSFFSTFTLLPPTLISSASARPAKSSSNSTALSSAGVADHGGKN